MERYGKQMHKTPRWISLPSPCVCSWDSLGGNVRELENAVERPMILCENNRIEPEDVQPDDQDHRAGLVWSNTAWTWRSSPPRT